MLRPLTFALLLCSPFAALAGAVPLAAPPAGTQLPQTGTYQGTDRASGKPCAMKLLSATRTTASPLLGYPGQGPYWTWNLKTTMTAKFSAPPNTALSRFSDKVFTLTSIPDKGADPKANFPYQRVEVDGGLFGIRGAIQIAYTNGAAYDWSYRPNHGGTVDVGPECSNMKRTGP